MNYNKTVLLPGGQSCIIRSAEAGDAESVLAHLIQTCGETPFLARSGDEIKLSAEEEAEFIAGKEASPVEILLCAFMDGVLAATCGVDQATPYRRYRHRAELGISVKKDFWGLGIGSALLEAGIDAAKKAGFSMLELEVNADNVRAIALYEKYGFQIYGTRPHSLKFEDGRFAASHLMMLEL